MVLALANSPHLRGYVRRDRGRPGQCHATCRCHQGGAGRAGIPVVAALLGARLLQVFGVSLEAFSIAGGGVLIWIGFSMLRGGSPQAQDVPKDHADEKRSRDPVRGEPRYDYRTRHARRRPFEARSAGHGTRRGRSRRGRNVDRDGARRETRPRGGGARLASAALRRAMSDHDSI